MFAVCSACLKQRCHTRLQGLDFPNPQGPKEALQAKKGQFFQSAPKSTGANKVGIILVLQPLSASLLSCMQVCCSSPLTQAAVDTDKHDFVEPVTGCMHLESFRHNNEASLGLVNGQLVQNACPVTHTAGPSLIVRCIYNGCSNEL